MLRQAALLFEIKDEAAIDQVEDGGFFFLDASKPVLHKLPKKSRASSSKVG
jgi:hypothetical protein